CTTGPNTGNILTTAAATSSSSPPTSSASARAVVTAEETSPDSKCPICLDRFNNLAYLDRCLHRFCFPCIQEWSHNKAECPLCKQPFTSILHSVRAEDDFKEYTLRPAPASNSIPHRC
uniref:E3 ubiquitin-protein ligase Topors n=1 Tax=Monopterus albus TaxID=43700 RepID=A0A3Q3IXC6_MONAL